MKKICLALAAIILVLISGCKKENNTPKTGEGESSAKDASVIYEAERPDETEAADKGEETMQPESYETEEETKREETDDGRIIKIAEDYRALLGGDVSDNFYKSSVSELAAVREYLTAKGYNVMYRDDDAATEDLQQKSDREKTASNAALTEFIELCYDGGFWFYKVENGRSLKMTRTAWNKSGAVQITDKKEYELEDFYYTTDGYLVLERIIPNNPASKSNHDGYKEPRLAFRAD